MTALSVPQLETEQATVQLTPFAPVSLVSVAVNACVLPSRTVELAGDTATVMAGGALRPLLQPATQINAKTQRRKGFLMAVLSGPSKSKLIDDLPGTGSTCCVGHFWHWGLDPHAVPWEVSSETPLGRSGGQRSARTAASSPRARGDYSGDHSNVNREPPNIPENFRTRPAEAGLFARPLPARPGEQPPPRQGSTAALLSSQLVSNFESGSRHWKCP